MGDFFFDDHSTSTIATAAAASSRSQSAPNKELTGHKLVFLAPWVIPKEWIAATKERYPGLEIIDRDFNPWQPGPPDLPDGVDWETVTLLVTGPVLPRPEQTPQLRHVQLLTAGANYALNTPLFKDTEVAFSTANGVHGWVLTCSARSSTSCV